MPTTKMIEMIGGDNIPTLGFGTWLLSHDDAYLSVMTAIKEGYRHIDTAHAYENEESVGRAIKDSMAEGTVKRSELFVTTKLWMTYHRPELVRGATETSLRKLQLDYVDLYLMHFPISLKEGDTLIPFNEEGHIWRTEIDYMETWKAMQPLVDLGLTRSIGVSNFNHEQIQRLLDANLKHKPAALQIEVSLCLPNEDLIKFAISNGMTVTGYNLLSNPGRPQHYKQGEDINLLEHDKVMALAEKYNKSPAQILLRWGIEKGIVVLCKTVRSERIKENIQIFEFNLNKEDMEFLRGFPCKRMNHAKIFAELKNFPFVFDP